MLHSLVACSPDGTVRLSHYFVETTPEQQAAHELDLARSTSHLWTAAGSVDVPVDLAEGVITVVLARSGLVFLVSALSDAGSIHESLAEDAGVLADMVRDVCNGSPASKLEEPGFVGKASVVLEQAACSGVLAYSGSDNVLRLAKLKGPKSG